MKKLTLLAFALAIIVTACKKDKVDPNAPDVKGKWKMVKYVWGMDGKTYPATENVQIQFNGDYTYTRYKDDKVTAQGAYSVGKGQSSILNKEVYMLNLDGSRQMVSKPHTDTLIFAPDVYDGGATIYVKQSGN